jgi:hypothetical protein
MAQVKRHDSTPAQEVLEERTRVPEDGTPIDWPYPSAATLIATDTHFALHSLTEAAREGNSIVLFFPDGEEVLLTPSRPRQSPHASR